MSPTITDDEIGKPVENAAGEQIGMVTAVESGTAYVEPDPGITDSIKAAIGWESAGEEQMQLSESDVDEITEAAVFLEDDSTTQGAAVRDERGAEGEREIGAVSDESADSQNTDVGEVDRDERSRTTGTERGSDAGTESAIRDEPEPEPAGGTSGLDETDASEAPRDSDRAEEPDAIERERSARGADVDPSELTDREPEAELQPEEGAERTDAEVEPDADASRSDAEVEPESDPRHTDAEVDPEAIRDEEPTGPTTEDGASEDDRNRDNE
ncbi:hypothetical protein [Halosolutus gelatinilyticus]|uniref:hypothetical protein n=1 Tax=Halosolutus gelatinilyticus TaxID=2931975 RepID=UPI001FF17921|nr:hypothetical protein [Halosolutus gelatinilyticus]